MVIITVIFNPYGTTTRFTRKLSGAVSRRICSSTLRSSVRLGFLCLNVEGKKQKQCEKKSRRSRSTRSSIISAARALRDTQNNLSRRRRAREPNKPAADSDSRRNTAARDENRFLRVDPGPRAAWIRRKKAKKRKKIENFDASIFF